MAVRRRKRREEEEGYEQNWEGEAAIAAQPQTELEPEPRCDPPAIEPAAAVAPAAPHCNELHENFDTSKFGRHVQAAYCRPTTENPSLSLRKRLKIAAELDRRDRMAVAAQF
jgi:hypothetical protein